VETPTCEGIDVSPEPVLLPVKLVAATRTSPGYIQVLDVEKLISNTIHAMKIAIPSGRVKAGGSHFRAATIRNTRTEAVTIATNRRRSRRWSFHSDSYSLCIEWILDQRITG
jgi:hypothetical protein